MSLGLSSVLILLQTDHPHKSIIAISLIILGGAVDFLDGFLARKLNATSNLGKQLDSFADIITFGIAPICLVNYVSASYYPALVVLSSLIFMMAAAYRLARYNMNDFSKHFMGLPITAAGIALAIYCGIYPLWSTHASNHATTTTTILFIVVLSMLMISKKKIQRIAS